MGRRSRSAVLAALLVLVAGCSIPGHADYQDLVNAHTATADRAIFADAGTKLVTAIATKLPMLSWSAPYSEQYCGESPAPMWGHPDGAICVTRIVRVAGFDGALADEMIAFDTAARQMGWRPSKTPAEQLADYQNQVGTTNTPDRQVFTLDNLTPVNYDVPHPADSCRPYDGWHPTQGWLEAGVPIRISPEPPIPGGVDDELLEHKSGPDPGKAESDQLAAHHYVVVVGVNASCDYKLDSR